ncbi:MAG TPA: alpha/beta hydrolase [Streptosporangiaceae bacterium]|jgi:pimeloyl-ACP methyl ester carboxylesterase|nr:alpha/beta hydrolase [Streptosporangiaceae bacterium]
MTAVTGRHAVVNGLPLYYEIHGQGRPLVLLPGGVLTIGLTFGPIIGPLATDHLVIGVEPQGHGHTPDIGRPMSVAQFADDVAALLRHLGIGRADVAGFSLGGMIALDLAIRHPAMVGNLVLISAPYRGDGFHPETRPEQVASSGSVRLPTEAEREVWEAEYRRVAPDPGHWLALQDRVGALVGAFDGWPAGDMRSLAARTLILAGDTDFVRLEHAIEMFQLIPAAQLAVLPDCRHMDMTRRPDQVLAIVGPFLAAAG